MLLADSVMAHASVDFLIVFIVSDVRSSLLMVEVVKDPFPFTIETEADKFVPVFANPKS